MLLPVLLRDFQVIATMGTALLPDHLRSWLQSVILLFLSSNYYVGLPIPAVPTYTCSLAFARIALLFKDQFQHYILLQLFLEPNSGCSAVYPVVACSQLIGLHGILYSLSLLEERTFVVSKSSASTLFLALRRSAIQNFLENTPHKVDMNICLVSVSLLWNGHSRLPKLDDTIDSNCIYLQFKLYASSSCYDLGFLNASYIIVNDIKTLPVSD